MNQESSVIKSAGVIKQMGDRIDYHLRWIVQNYVLKLMLVLLLLALTSGVNAQLYYGASIGVGVGKYYNGKTHKTGTGINDLYLSVPVGYASGSFIAELQPQITASNNESISLMAGVRTQSENIGIHFLGGYTDQLAFRMKPFTVNHSFHATGTVRVWLGQAMMQGTYFNNQVFVGVGVVGF